jgi:hypothetical protein
MKAEWILQLRIIPFTFYHFTNTRLIIHNYPIFKKY